MESLREFFSKLNLPPKVKESLNLYLKIKKYWPNLMETFSEEALPLYIEDGVLFIGVSDNYLLQELNYRYLEILEKIKKLLKEEAPKIKGLKFLFHRGSRNIKYSSEKLSFRKVFSEEESKLLIELCQTLPDQELSQSFLRLLKYYFSNKIF
jgi:hypothetical protein